MTEPTDNDAAPPDVNATPGSGLAEVVLALADEWCQSSGAHKMAAGASESGPGAGLEHASGTALRACADAHRAAVAAATTETLPNDHGFWDMPVEPGCIPATPEAATGRKWGVCPTCGPGDVERHPRAAHVTRCANCKEWLRTDDYTFETGAFFGGEDQ